MAYTLFKIRDTVRIPPTEFAGDLKGAILSTVRKEYEGIIDEDLGVIISIADADEIGSGKVIPGDSAAYYRVVLDLLCYRPQIHEVCEGYITEITEFGAFVRMGPVEGLIHVSQIMNDFINYDSKVPMFVGKESKQTLGLDDSVLARIVSISLKGSTSKSKIGLTMRQDGLGKDDWKKKEKKATKKAAKK